MPIFMGKRIVGFAGACSHVSDVGGSIAPDSREVYEEGICFPPVKLYRAGKRDVEIDCEGTSAQVSPGAINVVYNFTHSAFVYALKCILDPHTPYNEGITRAVTVRVPPRTILNAEHPAPVFARNQTAHYLPALV